MQSNLLLTIDCCNVCCIKLKHLWNTGSQYGKKPVFSAVATLDKHF